MQAVNQIISLANRFLMFLPDINIPDYDARASVVNLIRKSLPLILSLIHDDESSEFGSRMLREIVQFSERLTVILLHSIGRPGAQEFLRRTIESLFASIAAASSKCFENHKAGLFQSNTPLTYNLLQTPNNKRSIHSVGCVVTFIPKLGNDSKTLDWIRCP